MKPGTGKKVLLAMSGGVDSSVAAALLQRDGYEVVGCFMRLGSDDTFEAEQLGYDNLSVQKLAEQCKKPKAHKQGCCSVNDAGDARLVAAMLGIPFYVMNFKKDFGKVIDYFVDEYNAGRTPNPCVRCNDWLKFGKLHDYAESIDCDFVASGHYAQVTQDDSAYALRKGLDHSKDQSYVLFGTPKHKLAQMLLPVGGLQKSEVRKIAEEFDLPVFNKPDSQEICFVPDQDYARLVAHRTDGGFEEGDLVDTSGKKLGTHDGHQHFTIGQRRGVGVALGYPIYVVERHPATNTVVVGGKEDLMAGGCVAGQVNFLVDHPPTDWTPCVAKVRYNGGVAPARWRTVDGDRLEAAFDEPVEAVTPGQAVVIYDGDRVMGGGWIDRAVSVDESATSN
ncbi:MAG: tRNA 2-thiouridine(34) synthase MnmA [Planctomycetota bacterium]